MPCFISSLKALAKRPWMAILQVLYLTSVVCKSSASVGGTHIQGILGHASSKTTERYTQLTEEAQHDALTTINQLIGTLNLSQRGEA